MEAFIGQIMQVGFNFAPVNWATCSGQILPISQNQALFSLLGTTFGGNGINNFQLPNLQGRVAVGTGQSSLGTTYAWGETGGAEKVTLTSSQMPMHNHQATFAPTSTPMAATFSISHKPASESLPNAGDFLGASNGTGGPQIYVPANQAGTLIPLSSQTVSVTGGVTGGAVTVGVAGGSQPIPTMAPYVALTTIICLYGIFPTRS